MPVSRGARPEFEVVVEAVIARGITHPYLNGQATLTVVTRANSAASALRHSRTMAVWAAARAELVLSGTEDHRWTVSNLRKVNQQKLSEGRRTTWVIELIASRNPPSDRAEVATQALQGVISSMRELYQK
jgi:hypothetical protein